MGDSRYQIARDLRMIQEVPRALRDRVSKQQNVKHRQELGNTEILVFRDGDVHG